MTQRAPNVNVDELRSRLFAAPDAFLFVVDLPELYRTSVDFDLAIKCLVDESRNLPNDARARLELGIIYAKRTHSEDSARELLASLQAIATDITSRELRLVAEVVQGVILLTRAHDYRGGLSALESVHDSLRPASAHGQLYGITRRWLGLAYMFLNRNSEAETAYQDAVSTCRRYEMRFTCAAALNDYAVLLKRLGRLVEARFMLRQVLTEFTELGAARNRIFALNNLGVVGRRMGDWKAARRFFREAREALIADGLTSSRDGDTQLRTSCMTQEEYLLLLERRFSTAQAGFLDLLALSPELGANARTIMLTKEFLGELCLETGAHDDALRYLSDALQAAESCGESDIVVEILRRQAQLAFSARSLDSARHLARKSARLAAAIGDRYELSAATRVLGEVYAAQGNIPRAMACFRSAVSTLKGIHECYELMRTLYAQGAFLSKHGKRDDAEISLLEARQLSKKLELDYYQALIAVALIDALVPQERFAEATTWLQEATELRDKLEGIDFERVEKAVKRAAEDLQKAITRASVREAETLKTICRVYEDARFPIAEMKPDLAYQVAQSAGAVCLFVIGRKGGGLSVPLCYNIGVGEAKELVRQLDAPKKPFLGLEDDPQVLVGPKGKTVVAVPCFVTLPGNEKNNAREMYAFCACFDQTSPVTSRQMEIVHAGAEALARLIEDEDERHAPPTTDEIARARHPRGSFKEILTIDPGMIKVIKVAERAAASVAPILLEGETGVGKELFARAIHEASKRKDGPFVAVNAGGMSLSLLESELFGHVRGAFTDASNDRMGFVDTARGGTLFLDEIGETSEELQVKLLRLIENGEYRRLGESAVRHADVRFISATNRDLAKEVERGKFRRDLYYRVAPLRLTIPPLRMRAVDIQLMVRHFLRECAQMNGIADRYIEIDVKAMEALELYEWPGNVRELFNEILRVVSLIGRGDLVRFGMLSEQIQQHLVGKRRGTEGLLERSVEQFERRLILHALDNNDWNHLRTAESLSVPRTTLLAKLKRLNVPPRPTP